MVSGLALAGIPPFSGFWSEEGILTHAARYGILPGLLLLLLIFLAGVYISRAGAALFLPRPGTSEPKGTRASRVMIVPMLILAGLAAVGGILNGFLGDLLPFDVPVEAGLGWAWRVAAVGSSVLGMTTGILVVKSVGPRPALGSWPLIFWRALNWVALKPASLIMGLSRGLPAPEWAFDAAGRFVCRAALSLSRASDRTEGAGFGGGLDRFAEEIRAAGENLGRLQTGKVYLYAMVVFVWTLLAGVGVLLLWS
jgi:NADH-quinone oxidoreductase subunit L